MHFQMLLQHGNKEASKPKNAQSMAVNPRGASMASTESRDITQFSSFFARARCNSYSSGSQGTIQHFQQVRKILKSGITRCLLQTCRSHCRGRRLLHRRRHCHCHLHYLESRLCLMPRQSYRISCQVVLPQVPAAFAAQQSRLPFRYPQGTQQLIG